MRKLNIALLVTLLLGVPGTESFAQKKFQFKSSPSKSSQSRSTPSFKRSGSNNQPRSTFKPPAKLMTRPAPKQFSFPKSPVPRNTPQPVPRNGGSRFNIPRSTTPKVTLPKGTSPRQTTPKFQGNKLPQVPPNRYNDLQRPLTPPPSSNRFGNGANKSPLTPKLPNNIGNRLPNANRPQNRLPQNPGRFGNVQDLLENRKPKVPGWIPEGNRIPDRNQIPNRPLPIPRNEVPRDLGDRLQDHLENIRNPQRPEFIPERIPDAFDNLPDRGGDNAPEGNNEPAPEPMPEEDLPQDNMPEGNNGNNNGGNNGQGNPLPQEQENMPEDQNGPQDQAPNPEENPDPQEPNPMEPEGDPNLPGDNHEEHHHHDCPNWIIDLIVNPNCPPQVICPEPIVQPIIVEPIVVEPGQPQPAPQLPVVINGTEVTLLIDDLPAELGKAVLEVQDRAMLMEVVEWNPGVVTVQLPQLLMTTELPARIYIASADGEILLIETVLITPVTLVSQQ